MKKIGENLKNELWPAFLIVYDDFIENNICKRWPGDLLFIYKSNTVFETIVDAGAIQNSAVNRFFSWSIPIIGPVIARQALH